MRQKEKNKPQCQQEKNTANQSPPRAPDYGHTGTVGLCLSTALGSSTKAASSHPYCYSGKGQPSHEENHSFPTPPAVIFTAFWSVLLNLGFVWGFFPHYIKQLRVSGMGSLQILFLLQESNNSSQGFRFLHFQTFPLSFWLLKPFLWPPDYHVPKAVFNSACFHLFHHFI